MTERRPRAATRSNAIPPLAQLSALLAVSASVAVPVAHAVLADAACDDLRSQSVVASLERAQAFSMASGSDGNARVCPPIVDLPASTVRSGGAPPAVQPPPPFNGTTTGSPMTPGGAAVMVRPEPRVFENHFRDTRASHRNSAHRTPPRPR